MQFIVNILAVICFLFSAYIAWLKWGMILRIMCIRVADLFKLVYFCLTVIPRDAFSYMHKAVQLYPTAWFLWFSSTGYWLHWCAMNVSLSGNTKSEIFIDMQGQNMNEQVVLSALFSLAFFFLLSCICDDSQKQSTEVARTNAIKG